MLSKHSSVDFTLVDSKIRRAKLDNEIFNLCCKKPIMIKKVVRVLEKNYNKKGKMTTEEKYNAEGKVVKSKDFK